MFTPFESPFAVPEPPKNEIPPDVQIIFVADMFVDEYVGGAELTTQALIDSSPFKVFRVKSKDVTIELLQKGHDRFWIFGNWTQMDIRLIPSIVGNMQYAVLEYDYKFCRFRSTELHMHQEGVPCDCANQMHGKMTSAFYYGAMGIFWMSETQMKRYHDRFPFLEEKDNVVLSSVFDDATFASIKLLREKHSGKERKKWITLNSPSWIKAAKAARDFCLKKGYEHEQLWNVPYNEVLEKLATAKGFVYLPEGGDTCPRMVIEAKLLGCELELNSNVQHKDEEWFATDDIESIEQYLYAARGVFWNCIKAFIEYEPTISGYTTTYNCVSQEYPFEQSIRSMLQFCDEVCVVDGGSTDGTWEVLLRIAAEHVHQNDGNIINRVNVKQIKRDWSHPRHAVFDGVQKAEARKMCTQEFCWQQDSDEVVHESHASKVKELCRSITKGIDIVCLPVVEYWGGSDKVRVDATPWKWRLSRNKPYITHGIPKQLRMYDDSGELYALEGTDGCDMIHTETGDPIPHLNFWTQDFEKLRRAVLFSDPTAKGQYEGLLNKILQDLPGVFHYSWYDIERKIKLYRDYWQNHWNALFNKSVEDTAENNNFFDVPWSEVTDEMIAKKAKALATETGGWIFHRKWEGQCLPHIKIEMSQPELMR